MTNLTTFALAACCLLSLSLSNVAHSETLKIGDASHWRFYNSDWHDGPNDTITCKRTGDGVGLQSFCMAFNTQKAYSDLEAEFTVAMPSNHADEGFIVRAQDPNHYYLIHFPQCGQGYRAQNFYASVSVADGSGYLRTLVTKLVRRVPSMPLGITNHARVKVTGNRIQVWVNGYPAIDVTDNTYKKGYIGLAGFQTFHPGRVTVTGTQVNAPPFKGDVPLVQNWFFPFPHAGGQQGYATLVKAANGDLLCLFKSDKGKQLARSTDDGNTWNVEPAPANLIGDLRALKDGRLVSVSMDRPKGDKSLEFNGLWSESTDNGKTWSKPIDVAAKIPAGTKSFNSDYGTDSFTIELRDGTLVRFGMGLADSSTAPITRWGSVHVQAFSSRSTDGGKTWSPFVNLDDSTRSDMGNLDLTEAAAFETAQAGHIVCLLRPIYSPWMWETHSDNGGKTWGPCVRGPFAGWAPCVPVRTASGVVMFSTRFPGLSIHWTRDDGKTWLEDYVDTSVWAMGSMVQVKPNLVLFIYMDDGGAMLRAQFIRVTDHGLMPIHQKAAVHKESGLANSRGGAERES